MPKKRFGAEQIVTLLRPIEVLMAQGKSAPEACLCHHKHRRGVGQFRHIIHNHLLERWAFNPIRPRIRSDMATPLAMQAWPCRWGHAERDRLAKPP